MRPQGNKKRQVLLVDDQVVARDSIRQVLSLFPVLELVAEAKSGEEALEWLRDNAVDLVLMDINLPGLNGLETTARIKELRPEITVYVVTANSPEEYRSAALAAGASEYITKSQIRQGLVEALQR